MIESNERDKVQDLKDCIALYCPNCGQNSAFITEHFDDFACRNGEVVRCVCGYMHDASDYAWEELERVYRHWPYTRHCHNPELMQ